MDWYEVTAQHKCVQASTPPALQPADSLSDQWAPIKQQTGSVSSLASKLSTACSTNPARLAFKHRTVAGWQKSSYTSAHNHFCCLFSGLHPTHCFFPGHQTKRPSRKPLDSPRTAHVFSPSCQWVPGGLCVLQPPHSAILQAQHRHQLRSTATPAPQQSISCSGSDDA